VKILRARLLSLTLDLFLWAYLLYSGFTLYYLAALWTPWRPEEKLVWPALSPWEWAVVIVGIVEVVFLTRSFGPSLGQRVLGVHLVGEGGARPTLAQSLAHFGFSHLELLLLGGGIWLNPQTPWHERCIGLRFEPLPPPESAVRRPPWYRTIYGLTALLLVAMTLTLGWRLTEVDLQKTHPIRFQIFAHLARPRPSIFPVPRPTGSTHQALLPRWFGAVTVYGPFGDSSGDHRGFSP
jgi:hypothetical protein